jgi:hypothetical protein
MYTLRKLNVLWYRNYANKLLLFDAGSDVILKIKNCLRD